MLLQQNNKAPSCASVDRQYILCWQAGYDSEGSEGEEEEDLQKTEWMGFNPPYAEAVEYEEMVGLTSYKISKNPM